MHGVFHDIEFALFPDGKIDNDCFHEKMCRRTAAFLTPRSTRHTRHTRHTRAATQSFPRATFSMQAMEYSDADAVHVDDILDFEDLDSVLTEADIQECMPEMVKHPECEMEQHVWPGRQQEDSSFLSWWWGDEIDAEMPLDHQDISALWTSAHLEIELTADPTDEPYESPHTVNVKDGVDIRSITMSSDVILNVLHLETKMSDEKTLKKACVLTTRENMGRQLIKFILLNKSKFCSYNLFRKKFSMYFASDIFRKLTSLLVQVYDDTEPEGGGMLHWRFTANCPIVLFEKCLMELYVQVFPEQ